jgi:hypothetical protein
MDLIIGTFFDKSWIDIFFELTKIIGLVVTLFIGRMAYKTKRIEFQLAEEKMLKSKFAQNSEKTDSEAAETKRSLRMKIFDNAANFFMILLGILFVTGYAETRDFFSTVIFLAILIPIFVLYPAIIAIFTHLIALSKFVYSENEKNLDLISKIVATMKANDERDSSRYKLPPISGFEDIGYQEIKKD